ncbi:MAG: ABC transporter ATP-binding protein [Gemmatales bacterium]|nr:ABC transporter ATP-binding protein [Gemmatales bacterium]MDW8174838.1 ABC transporter ATP-binding protein [Gemmatales bacterium]
MVHVRLRNVSLTFRVRKHKRLPLKQFLLGGFFLRSVNPVMEVQALKNLSLDFREGDRVGVIGHNGAGKTTLLKLLAGIYPPTSGQLDIEGRVSTLLDIGVGIESDATGWANIAYRSYLQGLTPKEVRQRRQRIAEFSELGEFLNVPVRFYSSGMLVRLCFSIATEIEPEILLIDEILSAGDLSFQEKAHRRILELIHNSRLLVIATHDTVTVPKLCTRMIWLDHGQVLLDGEPQQVVEAYKAYMTSAPRLAA